MRASGNLIILITGYIQNDQESTMNLSMWFKCQIQQFSEHTHCKKVHYVKFSVLLKVDQIN